MNNCRICRTGLQARHTTDGPGDPSYDSYFMAAGPWKVTSFIPGAFNLADRSFEKLAKTPTLVTGKTT